MSRFVVVTPVLNGAGFIRATLDSVQAQTDSDWIHYIVDGGSTDGTLELIREALAHDERRRSVTGPDKGLYDALFKGLQQAEIDGHVNPDTVYVWLNSDDLLMPWALATLRQEFDITQADWMTALPTGWDSEGRLVLVQPFNWYPTWLIRAGQFNGQSLGWIQQESTFFTHRLLSKLSEAEIDQIRDRRLAGDFLLWRQFARHRSLVPIVSAVAGFRSHTGNASTTQADRYFAEIRDAGVWIPKQWQGKMLRLVFRAFALVATARNFRRRYIKLAATLGPNVQPTRLPNGK
jgi:glycosyltransferase involved in cell wall biosynthesis